MVRYLVILGVLAAPLLCGAADAEEADYCSRLERDDLTMQERLAPPAVECTVIQHKRLADAVRRDRERKSPGDGSGSDIWERPLSACESAIRNAQPTQPIGVLCPEDWERGKAERERAEARKSKDCGILERAGVDIGDLAIAGCIDQATARERLLRRLHDTKPKTTDHGDGFVPQVY